MEVNGIASSTGNTLSGISRSVGVVDLLILMSVVCGALYTGEAVLTGRLVGRREESREGAVGRWRRSVC